jgi:CheY-like chemotaxis protein
MGGDISLESEVEKGSTFTVRIPQKREGEEVLGKAAVENLKVLDSSQRYLRKLLLQNREVMPYGKVLVVDDMETNLYVVKGLLDPYRITVHTALSGEEAINKIKNESLVYDIIFMDHMMPNMDGIETTKALQDIGYIQPIVALTANATTGAAQMFLSKGFADFISKPIDPVKLDACLMEFIHYKQPPEVIKKGQGGLS